MSEYYKAPRISQPAEPEQTERQMNEDAWFEEAPEDRKRVMMDTADRISDELWPKDNQGADE